MLHLDLLLFALCKLKRMCEDSAARSDTYHNLDPKLQGPRGKSTAAKG